MNTITTIIPAYNEEKTIMSVIETVKKVDLIDDIIVVSDGSQDNTVEIVKKCQVNLIELSSNTGKGSAVKWGMDNSKGDILLFLDADLKGLTPKHITDLLLPVISNDCSMSIGVFVKGRFKTDLAQKLTPYLSGQRALKRETLENIKDIDILKYGLEIAITNYINKNKVKVKEIPLYNLTHLMKEEKLGMREGFKARLKMYMDIGMYLIK